jgi:hypothetical protein
MSFLQSRKKEMFPSGFVDEAYVPVSNSEREKEWEKLKRKKNVFFSLPVVMNLTIMFLFRGSSINEVTQF